MSRESGQDCKLPALSVREIAARPQRERSEALRCLHVILRCAQASFAGMAYMLALAQRTSILQCRWYVRPSVDALQSEP